MERTCALFCDLDIQLGVAASLFGIYCARGASAALFQKESTEFSKEIQRFFLSCARESLAMHVVIYRLQTCREQHASNGMSGCSCHSVSAVRCCRLVSRVMSSQTRIDSSAMLSCHRALPSIYRSTFLPTHERRCDAIRIQYSYIYIYIVLRNGTYRYWHQ